MAPDLHHCSGSDVACDADHIVFEQAEAFQEKGLLLARPVPCLDYLFFQRRQLGRALRARHWADRYLGALLGAGLGREQRRFALAWHLAPAFGEGSAAA